jgi:hypothetical protein
VAARLPLPRLSYYNNRLKGLPWGWGKGKKKEKKNGD